MPSASTTSAPAERLFPKSINQSSGKLTLSPLILGAGVFGTDYNTTDTLESTIPQDTLRRCFELGITAIDTAPYYTYSEGVLGKCFEALKDDYKREDYQIITKIGRYGKDDFDYSPDRVRASVLRSCELMGTDYIDAVYAHDVEFIGEKVGDSGKGQITVGEDGTLSDADLAKWGLAPRDEGKIRGPGDQEVLDALAELFKLKKEGKIRAVGFSAFPLPAILRLARLSAAHLEPLDIVQTYCNFTLQNTTLSAFLPLLYAAGVHLVTAASPLAMGALRAQGPQPWHPASPATHDAAKRAAALCKARGTALERVALGFGFASANVSGEGAETVTVVGLSSVQEVEETAAVWRSVYGDGTKRKGRRPGEGLGEKGQEQLQLEKEVVAIFKETGTYNLGWDSGV